MHPVNLKIKESVICEMDPVCIVDSYDKSICRLSNTGHDPGSKENLVKMICSLPSRVLAFPGGLFHPEMFCVDVGGTNNLRFTRSNKILLFPYILCCFPGHPKSEKTIQSKLNGLVNVHPVAEQRVLA